MRSTPFAQSQRSTIISGITCFVSIVVVMQLWQLTVTMEAFLGGENGIVWPAAIASLLCFLLDGGLFLYVRRLDR